MPRRPPRYGSSTLTSSPWWRPCCPSPRSAASSATGASTWAGWCCSCCPRWYARCRGRCPRWPPRALQGIGASAIMSVNTALISALYPMHRLGRGVGLNALVVGMSFALGPTVASVILSVGNWPWLFAVNLPIGLLALSIAPFSLPQTARSGHGFRPGRRRAQRDHLRRADLRPGRGFAACAAALDAGGAGGILVAFALLLRRERATRRRCCRWTCSGGRCSHCPR